MGQIDPILLRDAKNSSFEILNKKYYLAVGAQNTLEKIGFPDSVDFPIEKLGEIAEFAPYEFGLYSPENPVALNPDEDGPNTNTTSVEKLSGLRGLLSSAVVRSALFWGGFGVLTLNHYVRQNNQEVSVQAVDLLSKESKFTESTVTGIVSKEPRTEWRSRWIGLSDQKQPFTATYITLEKVKIGDEIIPFPVIVLYQNAGFNAAVGNYVKFKGEVAVVQKDLFKPENQLWFLNKTIVLKMKGTAEWSVIPDLNVSAIEKAWFAHLRYFSELRNDLKVLIRNSLPPEYAAVTEGLSGLDVQSYAIKEMMRNNGTLHLLVVSGSHIAILGNIASPLLSAIGLRGRVAALSLVPALWFVSGVSGFNEPILIEMVSDMVLLAPFILRKNYRPGSFERLGIASSVLAGLNPGILNSYSFWLSMGARSSLIVGMSATRRRARDPNVPILSKIGVINRKSLSIFEKSAIASIFATLGILPILTSPNINSSAANRSNNRSGQISLISPLSNAVAVPFAELNLISIPAFIASQKVPIEFIQSAGRNMQMITSGLFIDWNKATSSIPFASHKIKPFTRSQVFLYYFLYSSVLLGFYKANQPKQNQTKRS